VRLRRTREQEAAKHTEATSERHRGALAHGPGPGFGVELRRDCRYRAEVGQHTRRQVSRVPAAFIVSLLARERIVEMIADLGQHASAATRGHMQTGGQLRDVLIDLAHVGLTPRT